MKARKLKSGNWNVQVHYKDSNGEDRVKSFTAPTRAEAEYLGAKFKNEQTADSVSGIVKDMVARAIKEKEAVLSPATVIGYQKVLRTNIEAAPFGSVKLQNISSVDVQQWIAWMVGQGYSAKSIKNAVGVFNACYAFHGGEKVFRVKMPQAKPKRKHVPSIADVKKVLEYFADDKDMYAAVQLCAFASLRRGEVCALSANDVDRRKRVIRVNKAVTRTPDGSWVLKQPKTVSSVRVIPVSKSVIDALPKYGKCVNLNPANITNRFNRAIKRLGVQPFSFHDLRHFYASLAHNKGVSDITIQANAGWSSASTMKDIYWGEIAEETARQSAKLNDFIDSTF